MERKVREKSVQMRDMMSDVIGKKKRRGGKVMMAPLAIKVTTLNSVLLFISKVVQLSMVILKTSTKFANFAWQIQYPKHFLLHVLIYLLQTLSLIE